MSIDINDWDEQVDVLVLGYGGAGAAAAIEAAERGADTLVIERFNGGGATRLSGGIYYAGGGTDLQKAAGYDDTPEQMFAYLQRETEGEAVAEEVLRSFADRSVENFEWLKSRGVHFPPQNFAPIKTSYPNDATTLYYSGNEKSLPYRERVKPAPRGHRPLGPGLTGNLLFEPLRDAARAAGVQVWYRTKAVRLITNEAGDVIGAEVERLSSSLAVRGVQRLLYYAATYGGAVSPAALKGFRSLLERWEKRFSVSKRIRSRGGVVISTGGFIYNPELTDRYLNQYRGTMRLGTIGDDGSGIRLGTDVGAAVRKMERGTAWMFINPPAALPRGLLLNRKGERVTNEELYGAALGEAIAEDHDGKAILLLDRRIFEQTRDEVIHDRKAFFQSMTAVINLYINNEKAADLATLEAKIGMPRGSLEAAVARYNAGVEAGDDETGKGSDNLQSIGTPPFYAINADIDNWKFLSPTISLGGLDVDGVSAQVIRKDGSRIQGLYAAGRAAAGVSSQHYVSGLSVADGIFAGRNAGRSASAATDTRVSHRG
jgi:3-oxo-5alpha-steroid 4-dehydrogenase